MTRKARFRGERGVSAVLVALVFGALMIVAAFGVDIGEAYAERRHDQNTADAAVMSGMVEAIVGSGEVNKVVAEVRLKVETTLGRPVTPEEWLACEDPEQLHYNTKELQTGNPTIAPVTECISFSISFKELRVKIPEQKVPGVFGPMLGFAQIDVSASANAAVNPPGAGAPPFVALSTAQQGDFVCLRTSSNPEPLPLMNGNGPKNPPSPGTRPDPCDKTAYPTSSENFGTLQPYRYEQGCTQQNSDVEVAISIGIDHTMGYFNDLRIDGTRGYIPNVSSERLDGGANCTVLAPNTFFIDTGFNAQGLRCALISLKNSVNDTLCNGVAPRFHQGSNVQSTYRFAGEKMDNMPPWAYMRRASDLHAAGAPVACVAVAAARPGDTFKPFVDGGAAYAAYSGVVDADWDHYDKYDAFEKCLADWNPASYASSEAAELFVSELGETPRFAFIPQVYESNLDKVTRVHIEAFLPTYMYRLYQAASPNSSQCDPLDTRTARFFVHDAGQTFSCASANQNVDRLSSIILACGMVPDTLCNKETEQPRSGGQDYQDFRLVK